MARAGKTVFVLLLVILPLIVLMERQQSETQRALAQGELTAEFFNPEVTQEVTPTPFATSTPVISPNTLLWLDIRQDLETLTSTARPDNSRPVGWSGIDDPFNTEKLNNAYVESYDIRKIGFRAEAETIPLLPRGSFRWQHQRKVASHKNEKWMEARFIASDPSIRGLPQHGRMSLTTFLIKFSI